jgi:hypothetical protein
MNDGHQKAQEAQKDLVFVRFVPFGGYPLLASFPAAKP